MCWKAIDIYSKELASLHGHNTVIKGSEVSEFQIEAICFVNDSPV